MMASSDNIHHLVMAEIDGRIDSLRSGAPASDLSEAGAWSQVEVDAALTRLGDDRSLLLAHWRIKDGLVAPGTPTRSDSCGQPQPCTHVLALAEQYGVA